MNRIGWSVVSLLMVLMAEHPASADTQNGIRLGSTRMVLSPSKKTAPLKIRNDADRAWLTQVRILDKDEKETPLFIALPPLFRLESRGDAQVRVQSVGPPEAYASDREMVRYIHVLTIPASAPDDRSMEEKQSALRIGFENVIKLFWRPASLKAPNSDDYRQLVFTRVAEGVRGCNPTRYYLSFDRLTFDGKNVDLNREPSMLAPLGCEVFRANGKNVTWTLITDYGGASEVFSGQVSLSPVNLPAQ